MIHIFSKTLSIFLAAVSFSFCYCDGTREKKYTPKEFANHSFIRKESYSKDSAEIVNQLKDFLARHEGFFFNKDYFDSTQIIIDSIVYSPDLNKLAVFVITKNPTYRQRMPDLNHEWYYNATCYLGVRQNDTLILSWFGPNYSNSTEQKELSSTIRTSYFTEIASNGEGSSNTYNLNDVQFWDSYIWKKIEDDRLKTKEFENEKKSKPENIYEPKN